MSAKKKDQNGFITIENNPISRAGIFQYLGKSIGAPEKDRIYNVYRPEEELMDPETIASFKHIPIVDDHTMVGDGFTPAEEKGVHGTTGENVKCENGTLFSNLKIFSKTLASLIDDGKKHLSLGYRCVYEKASGVFDGQNYEYIQRKMRGNHLALVGQSRCDVLVLDSNIAMDYSEVSISLNQVQANKEHSMATKSSVKETLKDPTLENIAKAIIALDEKFEAKEKEAEEKAIADKAAKDAEEDKAKKEKEEADKKAASDKAAKDAEGADPEKKEEKKEGMDAAVIQKMQKQIDDFTAGASKAAIAEIAKRDALVQKVSPFIGTFDAAEKTLGEVAKYAVEKLGIKCQDGSEITALDGYLHNRPAPHKQKLVALDSAAPAKANAAVDSYLSKSASK